MRVSELVTDLHHLRESLQLTLDALNHHEELVESLSDDQARQAIKRIAHTHKDHVAVLYREIERLDPRQAEATRNAGSS